MIIVSRQADWRIKAAKTKPINYLAEYEVRGNAGGWGKESSSLFEYVHRIHMPAQKNSVRSSGAYDAPPLYRCAIAEAGGDRRSPAAVVSLAPDSVNMGFPAPSGVPMGGGGYSEMQRDIAANAGTCFSSSADWTLVCAEENQQHE